MLPVEFEGSRCLYQGNYWAVHNSEGDFVFCTQLKLGRVEWLHLSQIELQYARKLR